MEKKRLRQQMKETLTQIDGDTYDEWCQNISQILVATDMWNHARTIAITLSRGREINTFPIIEHAWNEGKQVVVPKCYPNEKRMEFRVIQSLHELEIVYFGLQEPIIEKTVPCQIDEIDLIIVPGIVFDVSGYRIGYGGGYYDRYLENFKNRTISLAFSLQVIPFVPREDHDIPVQYIITERGMKKCVHDE
ncbi:5-formyltetrahydrofolate cyclo-ligase [Bacillus sp. FJAT-47783]|uniref:5-formyltetrahydrofolate cyclo-ligase n=1 Tax=Bacillus sp. FJAT-47783 TaxID=2922712 RepID=UPI001FADF981|nr:5-formyltetrahydrofolate cyclo-ligase [Bacillus sp. FJAT-47783]